MTIAVTGAKGRLGSWFLRQGLVPLDCDITSRDEVREAIELVQPRAIINCAAWTDVDGAETEEGNDGAIKANTHGPGILRTEFDGFFIHISTGYVFDGKSGPYDENEVPNPISRYGWSKLGGEAAAMMRQPSLIIRTLDLYGPGAKTDFARQIRDVLELGAPYELPTNLYGSPTYIPHLAEGVLAAEKMGVTGILNIAGSAVLSRHEWDRQIAEAFGYDPELIKPTSKIKGVAPRPLRGGLKVEKAVSLGVPIYGPPEGLDDLAEWRDDT